MVEHLTCNERVGGSTPSTGSVTLDKPSRGVTVFTNYPEIK